MSETETLKAEVPVDLSASKRGSRGSWLWTLVPAAAVISVLLVFGVYRFGSVSATVAWLGGSKVWVQPSTADVGSVAANDSVPVVFRLKNLTQERVTVIGAQASCSCWVVSDLPMELPPGGERDITVRVRFGSGCDDDAAEVSTTLFLDVPGRRPVLRVTGRSCSDQASGSS